MTQTLITLTPEQQRIRQEAAAQRRKIRRDRRTAFLTTLGWGVVSLVGTLAVVLIAWQLVTFAITPFVAKGPWQVWEFLFLDEDAAANRDALMPLVGVTLQDAMLGFVTGMGIALALAMLFTLSKAVEAGVMPLALLLRSIPLVAIAPVILLITGRGNATSVAVIGSIVVLFPALASIMFGLSRASKESLDLIRVYGGSSFVALIWVRVPGALPSLFAAARVSVPGAVTGALLAEWLSTGTGIGGMIQKYNATARFDELWASVAAVTVITLLLYNLVQILENVVLARMGMKAGLT